MYFSVQFVSIKFRIKQKMFFFYNNLFFFLNKSLQSYTNYNMKFFVASKKCVKNRLVGTYFDKRVHFQNF